MKRLAAIASSVLAYLVMASVALAQQPAPFRVGWVSLDRADGSPFFEPFRAGLRDLGWVEGRNLTIEARWAAGSRERLDLMASELVTSKPHVIVTQGGALQPFRSAMIPIVFGFSGDPVQAGFVESLARPGRNFTGVSFFLWSSSASGSNYSRT